MVKVEHARRTIPERRNRKMKIAKTRLMQIIKEELEYSMSYEDIEQMSDAELIDMAHKDGVEEFIVLDGEGDLVNREEVLMALKDA